MTRRTRLFGWTVSLLIGFAAQLPASEIAEINGTAMIIDDRDPLPRGSVLEVDLLDISRKGEKGRLLSRMRFDPEDGTPITFRLYYDTRLVNPRGRYTLASRVVLDTEVLFRSTAIVPVLNDGLDPQPEVPMERVRPLSAGGSPVETKWRVRQIDGVEPFGFTKLVIFFGANGAMSGHTGCDKFKGAYKIDGDRINPGAPRITPRGCQPGIRDREKGFLRALERTTRFERDTDVLYLFDADGLETMRLTADR